MLGKRVYVSKIKLLTKRNTYPDPRVINTSFTHFLSSNTEGVTKWYSITLQNNSWGRGGGRYENLGVHNSIPGLLKELGVSY